MNLKDRFRIAPQMEDYDQLSTEWKPYTMYFHQPNFQRSSVSTDENGFRNTIDGKFNQKRCVAFDACGDNFKMLGLCLFGEENGKFAVSGDKS